MVSSKRMNWKVSDLKKNWGIFRHVKDDLLQEIRLFHVFPICDGYMSSSLSAIFVTQRNVTYALGKNRCQMLGLWNSRNALPDPMVIDSLSGVNIQAIDTGLMHTLALSDEGSVYEWGLNVNVRYSQPVDTTPPVKCKWLSLHKILQIACGSYFNLALTDVYTVMYWGYYDITQKPLKRPISFMSEPSIVSLSSGLLFSAAVGSSGKVYTWTGPKREEWTCSPAMSTFEVTTKLTDVPLGRIVTKKERPLEPRVVLFPETLHMSPLKVVCTMRSLYILMDSGHAYITGYVPQAFQLNKKDDVPYPPDERSFCDNVLEITCAGYPTDITGSKWTDQLIANCINPENMFVFHDNRPGPLRVANICEAFADSPTPIMRAEHLVEQDFDEPVYVSPRLQLNKELFCSESLSDVKFKLANEEVIPAHKYILLAHSEHFRNMYGGEWKETTSNVIDVSHHNPVAYKAYLNFLYNGVLENLKIADLLQVFHLADHHLELPLKKLCLQNITKSNIDSSNAAELYDWAMVNDFKELAAKCVQYGSTHLEDVLKSDGFADLATERREVFVKELFKCGRHSEPVIF